MADQAANPFDAFDLDQFGASKAAVVGAQAPPSPTGEPPNPFDRFDLESHLKDQTSTFGAVAHHAAAAVVPLLGSLPAIGEGAAAGMAIAGPPGAFIGGIGAGLLAGTALSTGQDWAIKKLPDSVQKFLGQDEETRRREEAEHPYASMLGGFVPYALAMRPGAFSMRAAGLPDNATSFQKLIANPLTARAFSGLFFGGWEIGQEAIHGESPDWIKGAVATGFGIVFNKQTALGDRLTGFGEHYRASRAAIGKAPDLIDIVKNEPTVAKANDLGVIGEGTTEQTFLGGEERSAVAAEAAHEAARTEQSAIVGPMKDVNEIARRIEPDLFAKYDDLVNRQTEFRRWIDEFNQPPPERFQELNTQRADLQDQLDEHVAGQKGYTGGPEARRLRAQIREVESERQLLSEREVSFKSGEAQETPDLALARKHLMATEIELRDVAPQVRAALMRAAEHAGTETVPPPAVEPAAVEAPAAPPLAPTQIFGEPTALTPAPIKPIAEQKASIAQDVARQLIAAGRPKDEAEASGQIIAARYEARAARLKGLIGTAQELYERESAQIQAGKGVEPIKEGELAQGARAKIRLLEGRRPIITLMKDANASSFIHETGHQFLEEMLRDAEHPNAPADLRDDATTVIDWLGAESADDIKTRHHEKFARGFEQYLREGLAPSPELANVFAKFRAWLMNLYQTIKGLGKPISEDIRSVFDRMLAETPQHTVIAPEYERRPSFADIHEADANLTEPAQAEPAGDRIVAETDRGAAELPIQVQNELRAAEATEPGIAGTAHPAGEAGIRPGAEGEMGKPSAKPAAEPAGGAHGAEPIPIVQRGGEAVSAGGGASRQGIRAGPDVNPLAPTPARTIEPAEPRFTDKAGNIRIENLTSVEDFAQAIRDSAERNENFKAVRGQATMGEMMNLAEAVLIRPSDIDEAQLAKLFGGFADMAPKIWALRKALVDSAEIVSGAMKRVREDASDANAAALGMAMTRHDMMQSTLSRVTAESGRTLGMSFKNLEGWQKTADLDQLMKENTGRTLFQLKMIAKLGANLDTPAKVAKWMRDAQKRSFPGMVLEYWINGLISGIATHTTYMVGNTALIANKVMLETPVAALLGKIRESMGEQGQHVQMGELGAQLRGAVKGLPGAVESTLESLRSGVTTLLPGETARPMMPFSGDNQLVVGKNATNEPVTWGDVKSQTFGLMRGGRDAIIGMGKIIEGVPGAPTVGLAYSPLGNIPNIAVRGVTIPFGDILRVPSRAIAAIHSFFRLLNFSVEKSADAYRTATAEGLSGTAFDSRVADLWTNPSEDRMQKYRHVATEQTLMGQGGKFTQLLSQLTNVEYGGVKWLKFIDPFVHISSNIINQTILQRTPVGLLSPTLRADLAGRVDPVTGKIDYVARDLAQARMLVGSALGMTFVGLASQGLISGSGPKDRNEAAMWRLAGNQAHSVRVGDTWYDMHRLGPLGMLLGISADMYGVAHLVSDGEYLEAASHLQHAITQNVLDESFMRGPASLIEAVEDPDRYGQAYIKNTLASFVPFSVGMAQQARATDPYTRQTRDVVDTMRNKIPGHLDWAFHSALFPKRDIWGEPMPNPDALVKSGLSAIYIRRMSTDPVNLAMIRLGIGPAPLQRKIRNVDLTDDQYDDFTKTAGQMTKMQLNILVGSAQFSQWPPYMQATAVEAIIKHSREAARGVMMMRYPGLAHDATQAKMDSFKAEPEEIK